MVQWLVHAAAVPGPGPVHLRVQFWRGLRRPLFRLHSSTPPRPPAVAIADCTSGGRSRRSLLAARRAITARRRQTGAKGSAPGCGISPPLRPPPPGTFPRRGSSAACARPGFAGSGIGPCWCHAELGHGLGSYGMILGSSHLFLSLFLVVVVVFVSCRARALALALRLAAPYNRVQWPGLLARALASGSCCGMSCSSFLGRSRPRLPPGLVQQMGPFLFDLTVRLQLRSPLPCSPPFRGSVPSNRRIPSDCSFGLGF